MATRAASLRTGSIRRTVHELAECFSEHALLTYASAISFRALVAIVPLTLLGLALLGAFGLEDVWTDTIAPALEDHLTQPVYNGIDFTVERVFSSDKASLIALATALVVWDMTWAVNAVMQALNRIHEVEERRPKLRRIGVAAGLGVAVVACLIGAVLVQAVAPSVTDGALDTVLSIARWPVAILLLWAAVTLLFRYAPAEKPEMRWASGGSLLVIATWLIASALFRGWVTEVADFKSATGSLTVFLVLTSYVMVSASIFLIGAEVDERARKQEARRA
jgi:membrane protein